MAAKSPGGHWATLLHFYQPYGQKREIIDMIVAQCYRPVVEGILAEPRARVTVNFTGVLLDMLDQFGHRDVIDAWGEAARRGQVELVASSKYHAILPLLPAAEARRQIEINHDTNRRFFGDAYQPRGLFLPEMAWSPELAPVLEACGIEWVLLDELAAGGRVGQVDYTKTYQVADSKLKAIFREHRLSAAIMSAAPRDVTRLKEAAGDELAAGRYIVTAMDGETFGHHRIGHERLLLGMLGDPEFGMTRMSDIIDAFTTVETVPTIACTWASSEDDIARGIPYISWDEPGNDIHRLQWELLRLAAEQVERIPADDPEHERLRTLLDPALASDQFFWAAARPWWMIEYIERGAYGLLAALQHVPGAGPRVAARGLDLYHEIMALAWDWQRTGKVDRKLQKRHEQVRLPFAEATREQGDTATWQALMDLLQREEHAAAVRGDYEAAILWRNGAYKLEHKLDIYDAEYVLDILHKRLPAGEVDDTVAAYKERFNRIRGGQVEQRSN